MVAKWSCACWPTCSRPRSSRSSRPQSRRTPSSTRTSMASTRACQLGATSTRRSAMDAVSVPATRTGTASARCTSARLKASGRRCSLARQAAPSSRLLPVRAQRTPTWQGTARRAYRRLGCVVDSPLPQNPTRATTGGQHKSSPTVTREAALPVKKNLLAIAMPNPPHRLTRKPVDVTFVTTVKRLTYAGSTAAGPGFHGLRGISPP